VNICTVSESWSYRYRK